MSINKVLLTGNLTRDPELRATGGGTQVLTFGVAVNDRHRNAETGNWEDYPNFIDCVLFGARAEALGRILTKGMKVALEGKLRYRAWETREGQRRSKIEVTVDELEFMSQRQDRAQSYAEDQAQQYGANSSRGYAQNESQGYTASVPQPQPQRYAQNTVQGRSYPESQSYTQNNVVNHQQEYGQQGQAQAFSETSARTENREEPMYRVPVSAPDSDSLRSPSVVSAPISERRSFTESVDDVYDADIPF